LAVPSNSHIGEIRIMKFSLASVALAVAMALVLAETHGAAAGKLADDPSLPVIDAPADTNGAESAPAAAAVTEDIPVEPAAVIAAGAEDPSLPVIDHAAARAASESATDEQTTPAGATSTSADTTSSRPGGRSLRGGGKSGLHGNTVPGNARRGRPQGKCHRKQTAGASVGKGERVR
jgi:hypothetical protein